MKVVLNFFFFILSLSVFSQDLNLDGNVTRAVVIGISEYQDPNITDLKYAHRDAEAFVGWLKSPAGGSLADKDIILLTNEKATKGKMATSLDWLMESSKKGDKAIIYFSGHGDVETKTTSERGFLLAHDSPSKVYISGAYPVFYLKDIIKTLSDNGVTVMMISDACRSGKIAGSEIGGPQQTSSVIALQFAKEIKILSCQPNEYSLESEKWGGGRGVFSYYLLEGLYGSADKNKNGEVTLMEIVSYLEENVPTQAAPKKQIPISVGDKSTTVSIVDQEALAAFQASNQNVVADNSTAVGSRGIQADLLENTNDKSKENYSLFEQAVNNKNLTRPEGKSAYDFYLKAKINGTETDLVELMRRTLIAAFQEETQKVINENLQSKYFYEERLMESIRQVELFSEYMAKGAELLGKNNYQYNSLKSKQHYFKALKYSLSSDLLFNDSLLNLALTENLKALDFEQNASYIYNDIGNIFLKRAIF